MRQPTLCIVSPHLDDAVLSCGIRMQRAVAAGEKVLVVNIFNAGTNAANRRREEESAVAVLGAQAIFLDELDAPDRDPRFQSEIELFHGDLAHVPEEVIARVTARLATVFRDEGVDEAIFPLAAGTHIDHRITYEAGRRLAAAVPGIKQRYYEDRPYILWPGILQARLHQLAVAGDMPAVTPEQMRAAIDDYHYLSHFVPPGEFRDVCLPRYFADLTPPGEIALKGVGEELLANPDEVSRIYDSLACYESQMPLIYPDRATFEKDSALHEKARTGRDVYAERSWVLTPA